MAMKINENRKLKLDKAVKKGLSLPYGDIQVVFAAALPGVLW